MLLTGIVTVHQIPQKFAWSYEKKYKYYLHSCLETQRIKQLTLSLFHSDRPLTFTLQTRNENQ